MLGRYPSPLSNPPHQSSLATSFDVVRNKLEHTHFTQFPLPPYVDKVRIRLSWSMVAHSGIPALHHHAGTVAGQAEVIDGAKGQREPAMSTPTFSELLSAWNLRRTRTGTHLTAGDVSWMLISLGHSAAAEEIPHCALVKDTV